MYKPIVAIVSLWMLIACNAANDSAAAELSSPITADSLSEPENVPQDSLSKLYTRVIKLYLDTLYQKPQQAPDTLFIGERADLPELSLPAKISGSTIEFIRLDKTDSVDHRKNYAFINIIGWVDEVSAEFMIVRFGQETKPQHDCQLYFDYNAQMKEFELTKLKFDYPYE